MKKILLLSMVMLTTAMAYADSLTACIYHNGNLQEKILLSTKPVMKMEGNTITLKINDHQTLEIPAVGTLVSFEDASDPASVKSVSNDHVIPAYRITGNEVSISGLSKGEIVRVYTIAGQQVSSARVDDNGCVSMPIDKGIMILKARTTSIKLINK